MNKVTTAQRLNTLKQFVSEFELDLLHYYDLNDKQKDEVKDKVSFIINYIERLKGEVE